MFRKPFNLDRTVRLVGLILILSAIVALTIRLSNVLLPFLVAWFVAYMLNPFVDFVQNKLKVRNRLLSVLIILIGIIVLISGVVLLTASSIVGDILKFNNYVQNFIQNEENYRILSTVKEYLSELTSTFDYREILSKAFSAVSSSLRYFAGLAIFFIMILYVFFILMDYQKLANDWPGFVPVKYRPFCVQLVGDLVQGMNVYFRKQALISLIVGVLLLSHLV